MKKLLAAIAFCIALVGLAPGSASAAYCGITWGSLPKAVNSTPTSPQITNIRTGRHDCYDRMVVDLNGTPAGYSVRYVNNVYAEGTGNVVPLAGGAKIEIVLQNPTYDENGQLTYTPLPGGGLPGVNLAGYQTFRDAKFAGSFEGQTTVGLGVRARLPFRAFYLGNRVVIDVAHFW